MPASRRPRAILLISPYFVPRKKGTEGLVELATASLRILTNSYDGTDVGVVHAGYLKWSCRLARRG